MKAGGLETRLFSQNNAENTTLKQHEFIESKQRSKSSKLKRKYIQGTRKGA